MAGTVEEPDDGVPDLTPVDALGPITRDINEEKIDDAALSARVNNLSDHSFDALTLFIELELGIAVPSADDWKLDLGQYGRENVIAFLAKLDELEALDKPLAEGLEAPTVDDNIADTEADAPVSCFSASSRLAAELKSGIRHDGLRSANSGSLQEIGAR